jgi:protein-tyrosine-phosphatase
LDTFSIVFVCTGNRFRSPLAEAFVRGLTSGLPVTTQSFGTLDLEGAPALAEALEIGESCGVDLSTHRSRAVGQSSLAGIDLLLGFEQAHVRRAVVDADAPRGRAFTFRGIARLLADVSVPARETVVARARDIVEQLDGIRAAESAPTMRDDMPDPFGHSWNVYRKTAVEILELSVPLVSTLFGSSGIRELRQVPNRPARARRAWWGR